MSRRMLLFNLLFAIALCHSAQAGSPIEALDVIQSRGIGALTPEQLLDLADLGMSGEPESKSPSRIATDPFFGQIVWWWAVEQSLTAEAARDLLLDPWKARYGSAAESDLTSVLQNALTGMPPVRTPAGAVYQPPAYVISGPIYQLASPFSVGWPGLDPQILSGISRISTGYAN